MFKDQINNFGNEYLIFIVRVKNVEKENINTELISCIYLEIVAFLPNAAFGKRTDVGDGSGFDTDGSGARRRRGDGDGQGRFSHFFFLYFSRIYVNT